MKLVKIFGLILVLAFISCQSQETGEQALSVEFLASDNLADMPFSEAVRVGDWLILSGQIGVDPATGALPPGGIKPETKQTMENIKRTLEKYGSSMDQVVKCTVMLADISEWAAMNEVYVTYFPNHKPARSAFGTSGLAMGARLEIECWAVVK
ncbi:MAG: RidA family protein [Candidatus Aminicenantes bacterium]|nr:RidA family protein [Candidatus Aminicenantes bacterium]